MAVGVSKVSRAGSGHTARPWRIGRRAFHGSGGTLGVTPCRRAASLGSALPRGPPPGRLNVGVPGVCAIPGAEVRAAPRVRRAVPAEAGVPSRERQPRRRSYAPFASLRSVMPVWRPAVPCRPAVRAPTTDS